MSSEKAFICVGFVSQHPPIIVAPSSINLLARSFKTLGVKSSLFPKNSFGFPVLVTLKFFLYPPVTFVV